MKRLAVYPVGIALLTVAWTLVPAGTDSAPPDALPKIAFNDNVTSAGTLREGVLEVELEIVEGAWHLLGDDEPGGEVLAFAERGGKPSIPGPLIRVPLGTTVDVTVSNPLDKPVVVRGLTARMEGETQPLRVPSGGTRNVRFTADAVGTYFYWGATSDVRIARRFFEDSQLSGAIVVDPPGATIDDQVMVMGMWYDRRLPDGEPDLGREFLAINGRPWPHTERLTYEMGDSVRWRILNLSRSTHSMHMHGFYYRIDARGDIAKDTLYWEHERRMAVTERIDPGGTMSIVWSPDRPGGWIFHCHMSEHVIENPTMGPDRPGLEERLRPMFEEGHAHGDPDRHAVEAMGGLVMHAYVRPPDGWVPDEPKRREMRLFIQSKEEPRGRSGTQFSYVLQEGDVEPAPDSMVFPASTLLLRQGEPTSIRVFNRTDEPSQIHWHGLEVESYFDGVAGGSGYPDRLTPAIQPGDSFEIRLTPPRAGSFMYHTHINDLRQQGSGLYGAFIVIGADEEWNPETDRIFLFGESPFRDDEVPVLNGEDPPEPMTLKAGTTYRLRFLDITLNRPATRLLLVRDGFPVTWIPVAKDGFDLPPGQRRRRRAHQPIAVGETYDFAYRPDVAGDLHLELWTGNGALLFRQLVKVE